MYVTLNGQVLSDEQIEPYNADKTAYQIFPQLLWRVQTVNDFLNVDQDLKAYDDMLNGLGCEIRSRVSKDGVSLLYCICFYGKKFAIPAPPHPYKEIKAIDFKFFKEEDVSNPPEEILETDEESDDENFWRNRLIRCKYVNNWMDDTIEEFKTFCDHVEGLEVEIRKPYIKASFTSQDAKDHTFEKMADDFEWDGDNVNYFRRALQWNNVSIKEYEAYTGLRSGL